jgi:hypothetical protein
MSSILLLITSLLLLLVYWFRSSCLFILNTKRSLQYASHAAKANNLNFLDVQSRLEQEPDLVALDSLHEALSSDYRLLSYLLRHTAGPRSGGLNFQHRLLFADFRAMQIWYFLVRKISAGHARRALEEMTNILQHFAHAIGERAASSIQG